MKHNCLIEVPEELDLAWLLGSGPKEGEELMSDDEDGSSSLAEGVFDTEVIAQLTAMGFSSNAAKRACLGTNSNNVEMCVEWLVERLGASDIDEPLPTRSKAQADSSQSFCPSDIETLARLGFSEDQVKAALAASGGNADRAADWLFNHIDDLPSYVTEPEQLKPSGAGSAAGSGKYELFAIISHMGPNANCGHYVCHIKKDGRWVIYNDCKVAASLSPPLDLGYLYFFQQKPVDLVTF